MPSNASPASGPVTPPDHWRSTLDAMDADTRGCLAEIARQPLQPLADAFYAQLLGDPRASTYLSSRKVQDHLKPALVRWIRALLEVDAGSAEHLLATQRHIGDIHARISIPMDLVIRGMGMLRHGLLALATQRPQPPETRIAAIAAICTAMDVALEAMTLAYSQAHAQSAQRDTAFRLYSLIDNASTERERQRALLLDWENNLLYALAGQVPADEQPLASSEFGLWFVHKALPSMGETADTRRVSALIGEIDALLSDLGRHGAGDNGLQATLAGIRTRTASIGKLLGQMFDRIHELDAGHDALTNLLNRRFLPTVLRREIELANRTGTTFALAMIDLDHFKQFNDMHGHAVGDQMLQLLASLLSQALRGSDYLFRLGGEEIVMVLASVSDTQAMAIAEKLRRVVADAVLHLPEGESLRATASIGVAMYDGHPDYARMLARADAAMYRAKREGRNRAVLATD
ncbi:GGDEF domain-containing protein [Luteimonas sp. BDR2-5]|uniref:GGDEF domain-containing protein n=1 Tax=Proluteimonas luteida TaxID=2878685 RepID=UPI001E5BC4FF|nr:GGDEF domain-containing protein [Luteimonas sp. BDR2-5]MCD9029012.1 GGDEF domain-containing protein [Luteimonas sp. BDR2-5]